jgi:hypothetical protein
MSNLHKRTTIPLIPSSKTLSNFNKNTLFLIFRVRAQQEWRRLNEGRREAGGRPDGGRMWAEWRPNGGRLEAEWRPVGGRMEAEWRLGRGLMEAKWRPNGGRWGQQPNVARFGGRAFSMDGVTS